MRDGGEVVPEGHRVSPAAKRLLAIVAYYLGAAIVVALTARYAPATLQLIDGTSLSEFGASAQDVLSRAQLAAARRTPPGSAGELSLATLAVLAAAVATAVPVAWVYSLTRRRKGFEQSLVHILILLPIAVAGMVVLIQNNLALAFSLAGIVAVLRFRNSLEDVKDGVYVFIAVTIGMSAGVGALAIGAVTSAVFNTCVLMLWWLDFARVPVPGIRGGLQHWARLPKFSPSKAPGDEPGPDSRVGDEVFASAARAWRRQLQITAEQSMLTQAPRFNAALRVLSSAPDLTRPALEDILREHVKRWELTGIVPAEAGAFTMKYRLRVRRSGRAALLDALRAMPRAVGVELR